MQYKGKELITGSDYYAAAMDLMRYEENPECIRGAVELFICGAELHDRFCISRLKEVARTRKYLEPLGSFESDDLVNALVDILRQERADAELRELRAAQRSGMFGVMKLRPINKTAVGDISRRAAYRRGL